MGGRVGQAAPGFVGWSLGGRVTATDVRVAEIWQAPQVLAAWRPGGIAGGGGWTGV